MKHAATHATSATRYADAIREAGNPRDQIERFTRAGIVLQPKQLQASALARKCDHRGGPEELAYGGARGGGKSHWGIAQVYDDCDRVPDLKYLILRKIGKSGRESFDDLRRRLLARVPHEYNRSSGTLMFPNLSTARVGHFQKASDVDAYLGLEYDGILVEEATTLEKSKLEDIMTCLRTSKPEHVWRPRAYLTFNPGGLGHAHIRSRFIVPWRRKQETDTRFVQATVRDNRYVNAEYRRRLKKLTGWKRKAWYEGDWDFAAGQYFTTWDASLHVTDTITPGYHWRYWLSLDYGYTHYTMAHLFAADDEGRVYILDEHADRLKLPKHHAEEIKAMLARHNVHPDQLEVTVAGGDVFQRESDGENVAADYEAHGLPLVRATMNRIEGAAEFAQRLGDPETSPPTPPTILIHSRCVRLIDQLPEMQVNPSRPEDVLKVDCDDEGEGGDDAYDCARYGVMYAANGLGITLLDEV
jgi:phage terminase large subunit